MKLENHLKGSETILIVEDEAGVRSTIKRFLSRYGYTVLEAKDGEEAIGLFEKSPSDIRLLLADVVLPRTSGRRIAEILRKKRPDLKILFMSGYTEESLDARNARMEDSDFIQKPFSLIDLVRRIRELFDD